MQNYEILTENRKNVAVIFADVSGFTALSEKMDPEEVREIINETFAYITKPVYELEGTIDKYIGDCVMILFGAKYPHSDDPYRAVSCGMKMIDLIQDFSKERLSSKGVTLNLSIGINYGQVVTGSVGNYFDKDFTVMGDVVNTAQRLQTQAAAGTILVSESVYQETNDQIDYSPEKEIIAKNKEKPVKCFTPLHLKREAAIDSLFLIERDDETNFLHSIYKQLNSTEYITIIGEAGTGKTSLLRSFTSELDNQLKKHWVDINVGYKNKIYSVLSNMIYQIMNLHPTESEKIKENRLKSYLAYLFQNSSVGEEEIQRNYRFLSLVMGLKRDHEFQNILNAMNYEDIKREIFNQVSLFIKQAADKEPFVFIIENIHWADAGSMEILTNLVKTLPDVKSLFILTSRYEIEELSDSGKNSHPILKLKPLSPTGTEKLACKLLNCSHLDEPLLQAIIQFTKGYPLHIKEYLMALKRRKTFSIQDGTASIDVSELQTIPNTIESLILANLSDLDESARNLLQLASVIGKEFHLSWLTHLMNSTSTEDVLALPVKMNIVSLQSVHSSLGRDKIYTFNQETVREVIYHSMLNKTKMEYHKKIAEWLEINYEKDLENYYEQLATHFEKAGSLSQAKEYYYKAAFRLKKDYQYTSTLDFFKKYLEINEKTQNKDTNKTILSLIEMGNIYTILAQYDNALDHLKKALEIANVSDDIYQIQIMIANLYKAMSQYEEALAILNEIQPKIRENSNTYGKLLQLKCNILRILGNPEALPLAEKSEEILLKTRDYENLAETMSQAGILYFLNGDTDSSLYYLNKAYDYAERINNLRTMINISGNLGIIYHTSGMVSKALNHFNKAIEIAKKISDIHTYIATLNNFGILYLEKGIFAKAESLFQEAIVKAQDGVSIYIMSQALLNLGDLMYEKGRIDQAFDYYKQSLEIAKTHGLPVEEGINYIGMAKLYFKQKADQNIPELLEKAYQIFNETNEISYLSDYYRYKSVYELNHHHLDLAVEQCDQAINFAVKTKNDLKKLKALRLKGILLVKKNMYNEAMTQYNESIHLAEQLESDYEAAKGYYRRFEALLSSDRYEDAIKDLQKAKELIEKVDGSRWTPIVQQAYEQYCNLNHQ
ncbi:tetratricopeptide repeat protein [Tepidibacillus sp. HK-1]|uniref:tetratricopeptide repeat protein n=1 Tax=Tepidibacillus sp. HK-1 TaxID=1883407 RepID=UPI001C685FA6|nr:tetratricopeptide repeat protein [Tepidibacillus sp. HK-1]